MREFLVFLVQRAPFITEHHLQMQRERMQARSTAAVDNRPQDRVCARAVGSEVQESDFVLSHCLEGGWGGKGRGAAFVRQAGRVRSTEHLQTPP